VVATATVTGTSGLASYLPRYQLERLRRLTIDAADATSAANAANDADAPRASSRDEHGEAALLFFDVSGFTRLTEDFARRGRAGAEALSDALNRFFGRLCDLVAQHGGDIVTIAGDAALVLWPVGTGGAVGTGRGADVAVQRAARCGLELQQALGTFAPLPGVQLRMRAGVSLGRLRYLTLGGVNGRWESLVLGEALLDVTSAATLAVPGELVASPHAAERLAGHARLLPMAEGRARVEYVSASAEIEPVSSPIIDAAMARAVESHLPRLVVERVHAGQLDWLAEFRTATVLFVNLPGLDAATAPAARLDAAIRALQSTVADHDGAIYQCVADDKGTTFIAAFGIPPHAHADDPARAVHAALEARRVLDGLSIATAIGVGTGSVFSGDFGSPSRRHYTLRGSVVNLAARLMVRRSADILCDATTARASARQIEFEPLPAVSVKGRDEPVAVLRPRGPASPDPMTRTPLMGREPERARIVARLEAALRGESAVVLVSGEPGIGKSHLLADAATQAEAHGFHAVVASADAVERSTAYYVFRGLLGGLLAPLTGGAGSAGGALASSRLVDAIRASIGDDPTLVSWLPLLQQVLPLGLSDSEVTRQMDAASRADATEALVVQIVQARAAATPLLLAIDDVQWLDSASLALVRALARRGPRLVLLLSKRPIEDAATEQLRALVEAATERLELAALGDGDVLSVVRGRLGVDALPPSVEAFVLARAEGHPLYAEELGLALRDASLITCEGRTCRLAHDDVDLGRVEFPQSLEGVITGRIDRLTARQQLALKTASVVGRVFSVEVLRDVYPVREEQAEIPGVLENLERLDVTRLFAIDPELAYLFKHVTTHEVAYNLLLLSQRRMLHRQIAEWYERVHAADLAPFLPLLAHHWERAEDVPRALIWLERAAEQALRTYANREVVGFLKRAIALADAADPALGLVDDARHARWERMLGEAFLKLADTASARRHLAAALERAGTPLPANKRAEGLDLLRLLGAQIGHRYAPGLFLKTSDKERDRFASSVHHSLAEVAFFGHDLPGLLHATFASLNLGERAAATRETVNGLGTLAHVASMAGLRSVARSYRARSLSLAEREGSLPTIAFAHQIAATFGNCVADWRDVDASCKRAIALFEQLGDRFRLETCQCIHGYMHFAVGAHEQALESWRAAYASAGPHGAAQIRVWARAGELLVHGVRGARDEASGLLMQEVEELARGELAPAEQVLASGALAAAYRFRGDRAAARTAAERVSALIEKEVPSTSYTLWSVAATGFVWLSLAEVPGSIEHQRAKKVSKVLDTFAFTMPVGGAQAALLAAHVALAEGKRRRAIAGFEKAIAKADALGVPWEAARARRMLGEAHPTASSKRARWLLEARERFGRLGAEFEIARIDEVLRG
jgi:class 3 adenylate cyclase